MLPTEFEVKFYPVDKKEIIAKLEALGAKLVQPEVMTTSVIFNRINNPQVKADYIRVRHEGDKTRLSAKVHATADGDISDQKEIDTIVADFDATVAVLRQTGLKQSSLMEKRRETWLLGTSEVVIDTWPGLPTYIEIEDHSEQAVRTTAEKLGFNWQDKIITSVIEIYMNVFNLTAEKALEFCENNTFNESPFKNLSKS
jgi:adenylate cyclase, class 2